MRRSTELSLPPPQLVFPGLWNRHLDTLDDALGGVGVHDAVGDGLGQADEAVSAVTLCVEQ
jgi:hypothetical protein